MACSGRSTVVAIAECLWILGYGQGGPPLCILHHLGLEVGEHFQRYDDAELRKLFWVPECTVAFANLVQAVVFDTFSNRSSSTIVVKGRDMIVKKHNDEFSILVSCSLLCELEAELSVNKPDSIRYTARKSDDAFIIQRVKIWGHVTTCSNARAKR